jgi:hypothetical protein
VYLQNRIEFQKPKLVSQESLKLELVSEVLKDAHVYINLVFGMQDVCKKIMAFMQHGPWAVCVLSANGAISNVTLRQPAMSGGTVTYEVWICNMLEFYFVPQIDEFQG